jgi:hypothetical protein
MPLIREIIATTIAADGTPHLAPLGLIAGADDGRWIAAPFHPSTTLANLRAVPELVANYVDDVRIFAGCLTGRRDFPLLAAAHVRPPRLASALAHAELRVVAIEEDEARPRFHCEIVHEASHAPFRGFNRAQAAVIEAAILFSRRHLLPRAAIAEEIRRLAIPVAKTAGAEETTAWEWLVAAFDAERAVPQALPNR